jgi:hypothetical protein
MNHAVATMLRMKPSMIPIESSRRGLSCSVVLEDKGLIILKIKFYFIDSNQLKF